MKPEENNYFEKHYVKAPLHFFENKDILTGDFRKIDLFSEPFNFQKNYLLAIEDKDSLNLANHKYLYLFSKEQIKKFVKLNN